MMAKKPEWTQPEWGGSSTDWRKTVLTQVRSAESSLNLPPKASRRDCVNRNIWLTNDTAKIIKDAAEQRGISLSSYMRRAVIAFAAHDLGLKLEEELAKDLAPGPFGGRAHHATRNGPDPFDVKFRRYGRWDLICDEE